MGKKSIKRKAYFVHIPKTAGNAVRATIGSRLANSGKLKSQRVHHFAVKDAERIVGSQHSFTTPFFPCYVDSPLYKDAFISFSVIRNPFDLLASYYLHHTESPKKKGVDDGWANVNTYHGFKSFEEFITFYCLEPPEKWHVPDLSRCLYTQLFDHDRNPCVDYIIYCERIGFRISELKDLLAGKVRKGKVRKSNLPKTNVSKRKKKGKYQTWYTPELIKLVEKKCEFELSKFGYSFDVPKDVKFPGLKRLADITDMGPE